jgi:hypothetical protein
MVECLVPEDSFAAMGSGDVFVATETGNALSASGERESFLATGAAEFFEATGTVPKIRGNVFMAILAVPGVEVDASTVAGTVPTSAARALIQQAKRIRTVRFMSKLTVVW